MSDETMTLKQVYAGWDVYSRYLVEAVAPLTPEQLELRPAPNLRNVYAIVTHIIGARARWFSMLLGEGGETMASLTAWDRPGQPSRNAAELEQGLEHRGALSAIAWAAGRSPTWRIRSQMTAPIPASLRRLRASGSSGT